MNCPTNYSKIVNEAARNSLQQLKVQSNLVQSNLAIRNFLVALKLFLNAKSSLSLLKVNGKLVAGNGSLIPICSLSNRSLTPNMPLAHTSFTYRKLNMDGFCALNGFLG